MFSAKPYDHQKLYDVRDQRDVKVAAVKKELGIHLSANHPSGKDHFGYSYDMVNSIEVWNSAVWPKNANPFSTIKTTGKVPVIEFTDTPVTIGRTYYRIVVEGPATDYPQVPGSMKLSENMVGLSNPIYFNFDPSF